MIKKIIPYSRQNIDSSDKNAVLKSLNQTFITQGPILENLEKEICKKLKVKYAVAVSSATAGLHICNLLFKNKRVLTQSLTFASTISTILYSGNKPILTDIDDKTLLLDPRKIKKKFDIVVNVLFAGSASNSILLRKKFKKKIIIEDASHALGGKYPDGTPIGSCKYSDLCVFSLHPVKSITSGEGGIITTNNKKFFEKLKLLRNHGIIRQKDISSNTKFKSNSKYKNQKWYYEINDKGLNYRMNEIQASLALSQLRKLNKFISKRKKLSLVYDTHFKKNIFLELPQSTKIERNNSAHHLYIIKINSKKTDRNKLQNYLFSKLIGTQVHYIPVHKFKVFKNLEKNGNLKNTEKYFNSCLSIPLFYDLKNFEQIKTIKEITKFLN